MIEIKLFCPNCERTGFTYLDFRNPIICVCKAKLEFQRGILVIKGSKPKEPKIEIKRHMQYRRRTKAHPEIPRVEFFSRKVAEAITNPPETACIISFWTPGDERPNLSSNWNDRLISVVFDDVDNFSSGKFVPISKPQAEKIFRFIKKMSKNGIMDFYIHCDQGISRSAGAAKFLAEYLDIWFPPSYTHYNQSVYRQLMEAWKGPIIGGIKT